MALLPEESTRHAGAGKRILQMPLVNPTHQRRCHVRNWLRLIVRGGPSQLQQLALSRNWYRVGSIDHRVVFSKPALVSAPSTKIILHGQLADPDLKTPHARGVCR